MGGKSRGGRQKAGKSRKLCWTFSGAPSSWSTSVLDRAPPWRGEGGGEERRRGRGGRDLVRARVFGNCSTAQLRALKRLRGFRKVNLGFAS